jgi:hypothetical protein
VLSDNLHFIEERATTASAVVQKIVISHAQLCLAGLHNLSERHSTAASFARRKKRSLFRHLMLRKLAPKGSSVIHSFPHSTFDLILTILNTYPHRNDIQQAGYKLLHQLLVDRNLLAMRQHFFHECHRQLATTIVQSMRYQMDDPNTVDVAMKVLTLALTPTLFRTMTEKDFRNPAEVVPLVFQAIERYPEPRVYVRGTSIFLGLAHAPRGGPVDAAVMHYLIKNPQWLRAKVLSEISFELGLVLDGFVRRNGRFQRHERRQNSRHCVQKK